MQAGLAHFEIIEFLHACEAVLQDGPCANFAFLAPLQLLNLGSQPLRNGSDFKTSSKFRLSATCPSP
jgi:hypothetical protein